MKKFHSTSTLALCLGLALLLAPQHAEARSRGVIGTDCGGCHGYEGGSSLDVSHLSVQPGSTTTLRFTIEASGAQVGGIYIGLEESEQFSLGSGSGLAEVAGGVTHTSPRAASGGEVSYELIWKVPSTPGATRFDVGWVAGNGNGRNGGDEGHSTEIDVVYGCEPQTFYRDFDGDGFGTTDQPRIYCAGDAPDGYAAQDGDCFEGSKDRYPGAIELCNQRDDDCDGEIDEGAVPVELYPDEDRDGFYSAQEMASGDMVLGCVPTPGYAAEGGDCDADNANANPGAEEVCDLYTDEDCNGRVDDRVRPLCGVGWCVRASFSCNEEDCTPGQPSEEACNFIDDDCDGEVDEGELCEEGFICAAGECRDASDVEAVTVPASESSSGGDSSGSGAGSASETPVDEAKGGESSPSEGASGCAHSPRAPHWPRFLIVLGLVGLFRVARRRLSRR